MTLTNWAGNQVFTPDQLHRPTTMDELRRLVEGASALRVLGSGHSFNRMADGREMVSLADMPGDVTVDESAGTVTCPAGMTYRALAEALAPHGLALSNLASLPHITVAGAIATATHGSGLANGNLATQVAAIELVTATGDVLDLQRGDTVQDGVAFDGSVVGLGALGVMLRVTLDVLPAYQARQRIFRDLPWDSLLDQFDEVMGSGYSTTVFCSWGETAGDLWLKDRADEPETVQAERFGASAATAHQDPGGGSSPRFNPQMGEPGAWSDRLPHFRADIDLEDPELQSEFFVPLERGPEALRALREVSARFLDPLLITELRVVAADELWLSPQYDQATLGIHFTWQVDPGAADAGVEVLHEVLDPFEARAHWAKLNHQTAADVARRYPRHADFVAVAEHLDPEGVFRNDWFTATVADL